MYQIDLNKPVNVYFSGIGGISMSGLARILRSRGFKVSGSDRTASAITDELTADGIPVIIGEIDMGTRGRLAKDALVFLLQLLEQHTECLAGSIRLEYVAIVRVFGICLFAAQLHVSQRHPTV